MCAIVASVILACLALLLRLAGGGDGGMHIRTGGEGAPELTPAAPPQGEPAAAADRRAIQIMDEHPVAILLVGIAGVSLLVALACAAAAVACRRPKRAE